MKNVLLLNASEEMLAVINWKRAITLLFQGKVKKPSGHDDHYEIKTVTGVFQLPTALVLVKYVRIPFKRIPITKENVLRRDGYACAYCGKHLSNAAGTLDHVMPKSRGGKHKWDNLAASCKPCNNVKDNRTPEEAGMTLKIKPYTPTRDVLVMTAIQLRTKDSWTRWMRV